MSLSHSPAISAKQQTIISPHFEDLFKRIAQNLQIVSERFDESASRNSGGKKSTKGSEVYQNALKTADMAQSLANDAGLNAAEAGLLKIALLTKEFSKLPNGTSSNRLVSYAFLVDQGFIQELPGESRSALFHVLSEGGRRAKGNANTTYERVGPIVDQVDLFKQLSDQSWSKPDKAASVFYRAIVKNHGLEVTCEEASRAFAEYTPEAPPVKGFAKFKTYNTSFRKLTYAFIRAINETETGPVQDCSVALRNHSRFGNVGKAVVQYFTGGISPDLEKDIKNLVNSQSAVEVKAAPVIINYERYSHSFANKVLFDLYQASRITLPTLKARIFEEQTLLPRLEFLSNVLTPADFKLLARPLANIIHGKTEPSIAA